MLFHLSFTLPFKALTMQGELDFSEWHRLYSTFFNPSGMILHHVVSRWIWIGRNMPYFLFVLACFPFDHLTDTLCLWRDYMPEKKSVFYILRNGGLINEDPVKYCSPGVVMKFYWIWKKRPEMVMSSSFIFIIHPFFIVFILSVHTCVTPPCCFRDAAEAEQPKPFPSHKQH